jgi:Nucleotidyltransferase of unknown function (DUF6036)
MALSGESDIENALQKLGELLALQAEAYGFVVLGGAALNLLGIVERVTTDVDILAFARQTTGTLELVEPPKAMPEGLLRAARTVARDLGLDANWLNTGPALQLRSGLPEGLEARIHWRQYGPALRIGLVDRYDLVFFKLYAAADSTGPQSVHYQDLLALQPTAKELDEARDWVATQDVSPEFQRVLETVVNHVKADRAFDHDHK